MKKLKPQTRRDRQIEAIFLTICGNISAAVAPNCTYPITGALNVNIYLANKADIASYTFNSGNPLIIEGITMVATKKFYTYEGIKNSNNAKADLVKGKFLTNFDHSIEAIVFNVSGATKKELEAMARGQIVAIVEYNYRGTAGETAFEVHGREQGLELLSLTRDANNADTQGAYQIVLKTPEVGKESHLPATFFLTSYAATNALVAALIA